MIDTLLLTSQYSGERRIMLAEVMKRCGQTRSLTHSKRGSSGSREFLRPRQMVSEDLPITPVLTSTGMCVGQRHQELQTGPLETLSRQSLHNVNRFPTLDRNMDCSCDRISFTMKQT